MHVRVHPHTHARVRAHIYVYARARARTPARARAHTQAHTTVVEWLPLHVLITRPPQVATADAGPLAIHTCRASRRLQHLPPAAERCCSAPIPTVRNGEEHPLIGLPSAQHTDNRILLHMLSKLQLEPEVRGSRRWQGRRQGRNETRAGTDGDVSGAAWSGPVWLCTNVPCRHAGRARCVTQARCVEVK